MRYAAYAPRVMELLGSLQSVHDGCRLTDWPQKLVEVARAYGIDPREVTS